MNLTKKITSKITKKIISKSILADGGGAVAATLPSGAVGAWYADEYSASPRRVIPNSLSSEDVSQNLFSAPRRLFANTVYWASSGTVTKTDNAATGPDGKTEASTVVCSGNWTLRQATGGANIPAGTYTLAINAKRNTGSDQSFCFSKDNTSSRSDVMVATDSWQRFTYTFTLSVSTASNFLSICSIDGSTAANLQICDFELYSGSSDLGPGVTAGHCYLGTNHFATSPAVADNELDISMGGFGQIQMPDLTTISSGVTFIALQRTVADASAYHCVMSKAQSFTDFAPLTYLSKAPRSYIKSSVLFDDAGLWDQKDQGIRALTHRYDGSTREIWVDDCKMFQASGAVASFTIQDFHVGIVSATSLFAGEKVFAWALWDRALTDEEIVTAREALVARATAASLSTTDVRVVCFEGDSITGTSSPNCYPYVYGPNASPKVVGNNFAVSGSTPTNLEQRAAAVDAVLPTTPGSRDFILSVMMTNDVLNLGTAAWLAAMESYLDDRRAAGWYVVLCTLTPRTTAGFNTARGTINTELRTWVGTHCDALCDFAADATMGPDAAASDINLYSDGVHPTQTGQNNLEAIIRPILNAI